MVSRDVQQPLTELIPSPFHFCHLVAIAPCLGLFYSNASRHINPIPSFGVSTRPTIRICSTQRMTHAVSPGLMQLALVHEVRVAHHLKEPSDMKDRTARSGMSSILYPFTGPFFAASRFCSTLLQTYSKYGGLPGSRTLSAAGTEPDYIIPAARIVRHRSYIVGMNEHELGHLDLATLGEAV